MARPLKPFVRSGGYYPSAKYTPLVYPGGYTTLNAKNGKPEPIDTFIGKIVQFLAKRSLPMVKLEANFTPVQSLNGQEAPWPPGGGKNLLDPDAKTTTSTNVYFYKETGFLLKANQAYTLSTYSSENASGVYFHSYPDNATLAVKYNAKSCTYTPTEDVMASFDIYYATAPTEGTANINVQLELGSTATAWSPYENICPISGHTGCEVVRTGKNLLDASNATHGSYNIGSIPNVLLPNTEYTFSVNGTTDKKYRLYLAKSSTPLSGDIALTAGYYASGEHGTFTTPLDMSAYSMLCLAGNSSGAGNVDIADILPQLEIGSTASDYEPYTGTTVSISFGQTVYGGKLTVFEDGSGQVEANKVSATKKLSDANFAVVATKPNTVQYRYFDNFFGDVLPKSVDDGNICNIAPNLYNSSDVVHFYPNTTNGRIDIWLPIGIDTNTDVQVCVEISEPVTIPLTASQINTLVGENVVWVNDATGDITVQAYGTEIT